MKEGARNLGLIDFGFLGDASIAFSNNVSAGTLILTLRPRGIVV